MTGLSLGTEAVYVMLFISLYFEVFMLVSFLQTRFKPKKVEHGVEHVQALPRVAIIVPCFNEERTLLSTLTSLYALEYPSALFEILVVDDGSRDKTFEIAQNFADAHQGIGPQVRVFHKENGGKHTAMNFALAHTDAEFIGCLDADSIVAPSALMKIISVFKNDRIAAVTPGILIKKPETWLQYLQEAEYSLSVFNRFTLAAIGAMFITPGPFSFFRAQIVRDMGGWRHGHSTEDMEMALRVQNAGYLIANAPGAVVYTGTPRTLPALFRQRVRWTYGFLRNAVDYRHMFGNRNFGNLGIIVLPTALLSIGIALYFFVRMVFFGVKEILQLITRVEILGISFHPSFDLFYFNTSAIFFLIYAAIVLVIGLIAVGSFLGRGKRTPPIGTPLYVILYGFLVPVWLGTALIRAIFKTGVRWR